MLGIEPDKNCLALIKAVKGNSTDEMRKLLEQGTSADSRKTPNTKTVLMIAARRGCAEALQMLLEFGANPDLTDLILNSAIHYAAAAGITKSVELLIEANCDFSRPNMNHKTPLMIAIMHNRLEVVKLLLYKNPSLRVGFKYSDESELTLACALNDLKIAAYLLRSPTVSPGPMNEPQVAVLRAVTLQRLDVLGMLIAYGADINYTDAYLDPPIFTAVKNKEIRMLNFLIDMGADVNQRNKGGDTPVLYAISTDNAIGVRALLRAGAEIDENLAIKKLDELRIQTLDRYEGIKLAIKRTIIEKKGRTGKSL
ncbi:hypothetical protein Aperf_G00000093866 [Anoplocephala perfoliata]